MIISIVVGMFFLYLSYLVITKEKVELIHSYHHEHLKDEDKKLYTLEYGKGLFIIGAGIILDSFINQMIHHNSFVIFILTFCWGFLYFHKAQKKYNDGRWFF